MKKKRLYFEIFKNISYNETHQQPTLSFDATPVFGRQPDKPTCPAGQNET
jgi:hypothetical protein